MKRFLVLIILSVSSLTLAVNLEYLNSDKFKGYGEEKQAKIRQFLEHTEVRKFLERFPDWTADSYPQDDEGQFWKIDFYDAGEWIGYAHLNTETDELFDTILPIDLSEEEKTVAQSQIETLIFDDAEVLARLKYPEDWDFDMHYDMYKETWTVYMWGGNDQSLGVRLYQADSGRYRIDDLFDPDALSAEELEQHLRDEAINLAYSANEVGQALDGRDDWFSYAEPQGGPLWTVAFEADGENLVTVLVDLEAQVVLEAEPQR